MPSVFLLCLGISRGAHGESDTHYQDLIAGERAAGMGGAFTALANEATGAYYNPAGIVVDRALLLQLSMSAYKLRRKTVDMADICGTSIAKNEGAFFGFPGSMGLVRPFHIGKTHHALALTMIVDHADKIGQSFTANDARCGPLHLGLGGSRLQIDRSLWSGLSYAIQPWRFIQTGITLGLSIRTATFSNLATVVLYDQNIYPVVEYENGDVSLWHLFFQWGLIIEPLDGLRFGLSITTPYIRVGGTGALDQLTTGDDVTQWQQTTRLVLDDAEYFWYVPWRLGLGAAYGQTRRYAVAADVKIHGPQDSYSVVEHPQLSESIMSNKRDLVVNFNVGGELFIGSRFALRLGFFSNFSSYPASWVDADTDRIDFFGFTLGGTYFSNESSALSLALQTQLGRGKASAYRLRYEQDELHEDNLEVDAQDFLLLITIGGGFDIR